MCYTYGRKAEESFEGMLEARGLRYLFVDDWYDYDVEGTKVEVKSCRLSVRNGKGSRTVGRFDFTNEDSRANMNQVWVALFIRVSGHCVNLGMLPGSKLNGKRYLSLHEVQELKPLSFEEWSL